MSLRGAKQLVPFSGRFLTTAIHRSDHKRPMCPSSSEHGKYFVMADDLMEWIKHEGNPT